MDIYRGSWDRLAKGEVWGGTPYLGVTVPFVLFGIFRYFYIVHMRGEGGRPTRELIGDPPLLINLLLYSITVFLLLYGAPAGR